MGSLIGMDFIGSFPRADKEGQEGICGVYLAGHGKETPLLRTYTCLAWKWALFPRSPGWG